MVSNAKDDFPEPESPVMTIILLRGISTVMSFRLWVRAPLTTILSFPTGFFISGSWYRKKAHPAKMRNGQDLRLNAANRSSIHARHMSRRLNEKSDLHELDLMDRTFYRRRWWRT